MEELLSDVLWFLLSRLLSNLNVRVLSGHYGCTFIPVCPIIYSAGPLILSRCTLPFMLLFKSECSSLSSMAAPVGATNKSNVCCRKGNKCSYDILLLPYNTPALK